MLSSRCAFVTHASGRIQWFHRTPLMQIGDKIGKNLDLVKINSAQKQVVAGLNYVLVVETAADSTKETYEAHVYGELQPTARWRSLPHMLVNKELSEAWHGL